MDLPFHIIFVHGYTASHLSDWYPSISGELDKLGWNYSIPDLPGYKHPHSQEWLQILHETIIASDKPLVLVGHSLGTRAVLLYLEKYKPEVKVVFLVAAFANRLENAERRGGESYPDFFTHKIELEKLKNLVEKFVVLHSTDDSSIPYEQGQEIAGELGAKLLTFNGKGHFSAAENSATILEVLKQELVNTV